MKKIIFLFATIFAIITLSSCHEKRWESSNLTQTEVIKATISTSDKEAYYIYPECDFMIYESNVNLNKYAISDYSYAESDEQTTIAFKAKLSKETTATYEMIFSATTKSGKLTIKYFKNEVEQTEQTIVQSISALNSTQEYIDLN